MLAGQGQVYEDMSTPSLLISRPGSTSTSRTALARRRTTCSSTRWRRRSTTSKARQAIYAATNFAPILQHVFGNRYPITQGFTGPGGICYQPNVPGYQAYDLAKAKALVKQLGGLTIQLGTIEPGRRAGDHARRCRPSGRRSGSRPPSQSYPLAGLIAAFTGGKKWQAMVQTAGAYDPAAGVGVGFRFSSHVAVQRRARPAAGHAAQPGRGRRSA